jgi:transposase
MLNQGMQKKQKLWSTEGRAALASLPLAPWTDRRRKDLLSLLAMLDAQLESLNDAVTRVAQEYPGVPLLMSQPGIGAVTALAFVLTLGDVHRFPRGKQVTSYSRIGSSRALLRRKATDGWDQQTRQPALAISSRGSSQHRGAL